MANSTVEFTNIDEEYPIAGQDNDSQGFRDNFAAIKQGLENAGIELSELLTNSARLDVENNFNSNAIVNASTRAVTQSVYNTGNIDDDAKGVLQWSDGSYQNVTVTADVTLTLSDFGSNGQLSSMRLAIKSDGQARTITFAAANAGTLRAGPDWPAGDFVVTSSSNATIVDVWTSDSGGTVYLRNLGTFEVI